MSLSIDDSVLITCSEDGSICIWEVKEVIDRVKNVDNRFKYSDDILVKRSKLEKINDKIDELKVVVDKLEIENATSVKKLKETKQKEFERMKTVQSLQIFNTIRKNKVMYYIRNKMVTRCYL